MWLVQVTGSLSVLNPAECTALIRVCVGVGLPQLVSLGDESKEFPRFDPGAMSLTASCGVSWPVVALPPAPELPPDPGEPAEKVSRNLVAVTSASLNCHSLHYTEVNRGDDP